MDYTCNSVAAHDDKLFLPVEVKSLLVVNDQFRAVVLESEDVTLRSVSNLDGSDAICIGATLVNSITITTLGDTSASFSIRTRYWQVTKRPAIVRRQILKQNGYSGHVNEDSTIPRHYIEAPPTSSVIDVQSVDGVFEAPDCIVGNCRITNIKVFKIVQSLQVREARVANSGPIEIQVLQFRQPCQVLKSIVGDSRGTQLQFHQTGEATNARQSSGTMPRGLGRTVGAVCCSEPHGQTR